MSPKIGKLKEKSDRKLLEEAFRNSVFLVHDLLHGVKLLVSFVGIVRKTFLLSWDFLVALLLMMAENFVIVI